MKKKKDKNKGWNEGLSLILERREGAEKPTPTRHTAVGHSPRAQIPLGIADIKRTPT